MEVAVQQARSLIIAGEIKQAVEEMLRWKGTETKWKDSVRQLATRYVMFKSRRRMGISYEDTERNRIISGLLQLISQAEAKTIWPLKKLLRATVMSWEEAQIIKGLARLSELQRPTPLGVFLLWVMEVHPKKFDGMIRSESEGKIDPNFQGLLSEAPLGKLKARLEQRISLDEWKSSLLMERAIHPDLISEWLNFHRLRSIYEPQISRAIHTSWNRRDKLVDASVFVLFFYFALHFIKDHPVDDVLEELAEEDRLEGDPEKEIDPEELNLSEED